MWILDELKRRKDDVSTAIIHRDTILNYSQLWSYSESIAKWIELHVHTKAPILIYGDKDLEIPIVMMAALKSGRAYVPVDITFPEDRLRAIADITNAELIFNFSETAIEESEAFSSFNIINKKQFVWILSQPPAYEGCIREENWVGDEDICYILFTSGSTGVPKGVQISKSNIVNFVEWFAPYASLKEGDIALNQVSYSFDVSVIQIYLYLASGICLFCIDKKMLSDYGELFFYLESSHIAAWVSTPAFIELCAVYNAFNHNLLPNLECVILAGEVLTKKLVSALWEKFPGIRVINGYGPTEGTVLLTCCEIIPEMVNDAENELPIGKILNDGIYWLEDQDKKLVHGDLQKGELIVSSKSISRGYFNNEEATKKNFFQSDHGQTYRTGDLVYSLNGFLYYCGRIDFQIKLNGYRIELDDISENLNKVDCVSNNVVLPVYRDGRVSFIAAFVVLSRDLNLSPAKTVIYLKKALGEFVPSYMIPKKIVILDEFPLNTNGKIDRNYLKEKYL